MKFSRKTDYGIILLKALIPTFSNGKYIPLSLVAQKNNLPQIFLGKVAEILRGKRYLESKRGSSGGYRLQKNPQRITFQEIIESLEESPMMRCLRAGDPREHCPLVDTCPTHKTWKEIQTRMSREFKKVTLAKI